MSIRIKYKRDDYHLAEIAAINRVFFKKLKPGPNHAYYVYGMVQKGRPPIRVEDDLQTETPMATLQPFFSRNRIRLEHHEKDDTEGMHDRIGIGLRRDIRTKLKFAAAIVRTIVAYLEGKLALDRKFKMPKPRRGAKCAV